MSPLSLLCYVSVDLLELFGKINVKPIILPVNSDFVDDLMGVG